MLAAPTELRPGITNPNHWFPDRPPDSEWRRLRRRVLERDDHTCYFCGHRATKWMNIHHSKSGSDNRPQNLQTICVACHAVLHIGHSLGFGVIEIWKSRMSQVEIVKRTRKGVEGGKSLTQIKKSLQLRRGPYPPRSLKYADELVDQMGRSSRAYLDKPLCAVFIKMKRWQVEDGVWTSLLKTLGHRRGK
jgi:hypothetical protein